LTETKIRELLFTKYVGWHYEEEGQCWFNLKEHDSNDLYFYGFNDKVQLREVIAGPLCDATRARIDAALKAYEDHICVRKARLAFGMFRSHFKTRCSPLKRGPLT